MPQIIDTDAAIQTLVKAGFKTLQARAMVRTLTPTTKDLVTKDDLKLELSALRNELKFFMIQVALGQMTVIVGVIIAMANFK